MDVCTLIHASGQTKQTDTHTDTLFTILCTATGEGGCDVIRNGEASWLLGEVLLLESGCCAVARLGLAVVSSCTGGLND